MRTYEIRDPNQVVLYGDILKDSSCTGEIKVNGRNYVPAVMKVAKASEKQRNIPLLVKKDFGEIAGAAVRGHFYTCMVKQKDGKARNKLFVFANRVAELKLQNPNYVCLEGAIKSRPFYTVDVKGKEITKVWIEVPNVSNHYSSVQCVAFGFLARRIRDMQKGMILKIEGKVHSGKDFINVIISKKW